MELIGILIYGFTIYVIMGIGFAIASWLQAAEIARIEKLPEPNFLWKLLFTFGWLFIAIYCYRAEVKMTIPDLQYQMETRK